MGRKKVLDVANLASTQEEAEIDMRTTLERESKEQRRLKGNQLGQALAEALALKQLGAGKK